MSVRSSGRMSDVSDPGLKRLLARRTKEPEPANSPESLNLSFSTGLEDDEETKQKLAYLSYETETLDDKNRELESENQRLRLLLRTRENDMFRIKNEMDELKTATTGGGLGSDKAIQRIVELSKKNRDLVSQLESEKSNNKRLSNKLNNLNNQEVQKKLKSAVRAKKEEDKTQNATPTEDKEKILKDKVSTLSAKLTEVSHLLDTMKQENKLLSKLLQREVGETATVQSILANPNTWRGRAEQVSVLQNKLSNLKLEDAAPSRMGRQRQKDIKILENNRKQLLQECKKENDLLKEEISQSRRNYDAVKARNGTLGSEMKTLRTQLAALVEKGRNDDNLISELMQEKEGSDGFGRTDATSQHQTDLINMLKEKVEMLELTVGAKDRRIAQLEQEITRTREISMNLRPVSQPRSAPTEGSNILKNGGGGGGGFDTSYLLRATEVEKDRLFELTDVLNSRISRLEEEKVEGETNLRKSCRQLVDLERLVENLKCKKLPRCDGCNKSATLLHPPPESQMSLLEDEISVLKSHLEAISGERQQDLVKYKQLLDQSRHVFVAGLKEMQRKLS